MVGEFEGDAYSDACCLTPFLVVDRSGTLIIRSGDGSAWHSTDRSEWVHWRTPSNFDCAFLSYPSKQREENRPTLEVFMKPSLSHHQHELLEKIRLQSSRAEVIPNSSVNTRKFLTRSSFSVQLLSFQITNTTSALELIWNVEEYFRNKLWLHQTRSVDIDNIIIPNIIKNLISYSYLHSLNMMLFSNGWMLVQSINPIVS